MSGSIAPLLGLSSAAVVTAGVAAICSAGPVARTPPSTLLTGTMDEPAPAEAPGALRSATRRRLVLAAGLAPATLVFGVALSAAAAVCLWARPRLGGILETRRRRRRIELDFPDVLDMFVLLVHAGVTPRQAIDELGRRGPTSCQRSFEHVRARADRGVSFADSLPILVDELGQHAVALVDLVGTADRYGLPMAAVLEQLAAEARATRRRIHEAAARSLPVKLSFPLVVCTLPSFVLLAIVPAVMAALSSLGGNAW